MEFGYIQLLVNPNPVFIQTSLEISTLQLFSSAQRVDFSGN